MTNPMQPTTEIIAIERNVFVRAEAAMFWYPISGSDSSTGDER